MKKYIVMLLIITASVVFANEAATSETAEKVGAISSINGRVTLYDGVSPRGEKVENTETPIFVKNRVATKSSSTAIINMIAEDKIALTENSMLTIEGINTYKPEEGKVVFSIKTRGQTAGLNIQLKTAVIGVKGTEFLIDTTADGEQDCYLKEGEVEVTPIEGQFKKYMEVQMDEYEAYVRKMAGEYDQYLKELEEQYVEYVDKIVIKAGNAWSIRGNEVRKLEFTEDINSAFDLLDKEVSKLSEEKQEAPAAAEKPVTIEPKEEQPKKPVKVPEKEHTDDSVKKISYDSIEAELESEFK